MDPIPPWMWARTSRGEQMKSGMKSGMNSGRPACRAAMADTALSPTREENLSTLHLLVLQTEDQRKASHSATVPRMRMDAGAGPSIQAPIPSWILIQGSTDDLSRRRQEA